MTFEAGAPLALREKLDISAGVSAAVIEDRGYAHLRGVVDAGWLAAVARYAAGLPAPADAHEVTHRLGPGDDEVIRALVEDRRLRGFLELVASALHPRSNPAGAEIHDVTLRVINGPDPAARPLWFHYDATVLTVMLPIEIPGPEPSGELVICPNLRPFRRMAATNIIEKAIMLSGVHRRRFYRRLHQLRTEVVRLQPGDVYLFCGYRSYHAPLPCPAGTRRVTLILHYKDVHAGSRLLRSARALRKMID